MLRFFFFTVYFKKSVETFDRFFFLFFYHSFRQYYYIVFIFSIDVFNIFFFSIRTSFRHDFILSFFCAIVVVLSTFQSFFLFVLHSKSIFNVVTTTKNRCLLFVIFHMLTMISNYQFDYFENFHLHQKTFIIMKFSANYSLFFDFCSSYDSNSRFFEWKMFIYNFNR